ncbi:hypothetical protein BHE74_00057450 [Ensete ventricosum]|nr:hypothetical protein GW17_00040688 [Ensete ventricosum]RWW37436.1 hypothetical protein BHE74_00057450 [Ensete ventricosum]
MPVTAAYGESTHARAVEEPLTREGSAHAGCLLTMAYGQRRHLLARAIACEHGPVGRLPAARSDAACSKGITTLAVAHW